MAGCNNNPADGREPVALAHRGHQGAAGRTRDRRGRQRAPAVHRPGHRRDRRPAERAADADSTRRASPWGPTPITDACHDITTFPEIGLAAGACEGNGILIDISDPANPVRIDEVADPNFAYWHSATFNNDGTKVIFTDEWGGGTAARCRETDQPEWGANAIFDIVDGKMQFASYYKLPVPQTVQENCVAHNGSLVPVPGRDIMVQAWYQGGISLIDFTDSANPVEIGFFDRGPISADRARARRLLVGLLVQRPHLRQRDRPRLRRVRAASRART